MSSKSVLELICTDSRIYITSSLSHFMRFTQGMQETRFLMLSDTETPQVLCH